MVQAIPDVEMADAAPDIEVPIEGGKIVRYPHKARLITKMIGVIVCNKNYDERRKQKGFESFIDLPAVDDDMIEAKKGMLNLGVKEADLITVPDASYDKFTEIF